MEINLKNWIINFVKNKDLIVKKLLSFEEKDCFLLFHFKDKDVKYYVKEQLTTDVLSIVNEKCFKMIICQANRTNLDFLIDNWNSFKDIETLTLIFARTSDNTRWMICPFVHQKICDDESLKLGLISMYENTF